MKKIILLAAALPMSAFGASNDCATRRDVPAGEMSLQDVIELGLCRNPQTASAYLSAKSARFAKNAG